MDPRTGAIAEFETEQDAFDAGHTVLLTPRQARRLLKMRRSDRIKWAKKALSVAGLKERAALRDQETDGFCGQSQVQPGGEA